MSTMPTVSATSAAGVFSEKEKQRLKEAAGDFESLFVQQLMRTMRKSVPENGLFGTSNGEKIFREMLDDEYAKLASKAPEGLGLKGSLYRQLTGDRSA